MAEPNLTIIRGKLLALASAHPRASAAAAFAAGVVLTLAAVAWL